jgi:uncharacterized protein YbcI
MTEREEPGIDPTKITEAISQEIATIHTESYDTPVKRVITHALDDLVVTVLDIELTRIEQRMIQFGHGNLVHEMRHAVQTAEAASFIAVVERATGRRVIAFSSHTHLQPPFAAELFRLGPATAHPQEPQ